MGTPQITKVNMPFNRDTSIPSRERSVFVIKEENYEQPAPGDDKSAYTEEEEVLIKKRLEDLGYLWKKVERIK